MITPEQRLTEAVQKSKKHENGAKKYLEECLFPKKSFKTEIPLKNFTFFQGENCAIVYNIL